jgi:hypothetical protein
VPAAQAGEGTDEDRLYADQQGEAGVRVEPGSRTVSSMLWPPVVQASITPPSIVKWKD